MKKQKKRRNLLLTRNRLREGYATDTIFSKVTSFEGYNCAQGFVGIDSRYRSAFGVISETEGPKEMIDFFKEDGVPISITRDNSKSQTRKTWNEYMISLWVKDNFIETHHPEQNTFERYQDNWKSKLKKRIIDYNVDPTGWFHVMQHTADLHNNCANRENEDNIPPITLEKGGVGDITLLTEFHFNEDILYQEYDYKYPKEGGN